VGLGPEDAAQRVTGPALDFCLCVTAREAAAPGGGPGDEFIEAVPKSASGKILRRELRAREQEQTD
jgi:hypothetical protein